MVSCSLPTNPLTGSGSIRGLIHTATGFVIEASKQAAATIELGKMGVHKATETVGDLTNRVDQVGQGIDSIKKGKDMIEKAVKK